MPESDVHIGIFRLRSFLAARGSYCAQDDSLVGRSGVGKLHGLRRGLYSFAALRLVG